MKKGKLGFQTIVYPNLWWGVFMYFKNLKCLQINAIDYNLYLFCVMGGTDHAAKCSENDC